MSEHNRREGYWQYYELAKEVEAPSLKRTLIEIIRENPCPRRENGNRGRPPVHSKEKLDFACLLMMAGNNTYRGVESDLRGMRTPWDNEPVPDHTTLVRHLQTIPADWLDLIVAETARRCIKEADEATGPLGADSSAAETTRYEYAKRPNRKERDFVETRQKTYWKYHITAILGLQIVLAAFTTPSNINDTTMLPVMLAEIRRRGFDFAGNFFDGDKGYDSDYNCELLFWMGSNRIKDSENSAMRHTNRKTLIEPLPRDHMRPAKAVKLGEEFLKGISEGELVSMQVMEKDYKVKAVLQAARHRKRGMLLKEISEAIGEAVSTVHGWLMRLEEGMERRYDRKSPGRPCRLSDAQKEALGGDLDKSPEKSGFFSSVWTARLVARRIWNRFEIKYGDRGALKLTARMNFSVRTARPVPYNSATKEELEKYVSGTVEAVKRHDEERFKILFLDIAGAVDSPASKRGIRRRGGRDTVPINHSKKSVKIVGTLGMGTLDIQFHEKTNSESVIALLEYLRRRYGRIFVILDNAAAHTSTAMGEYIGRAVGDVVLWFLPPRTP